jgi:hypothetical protein
MSAPDPEKEIQERMELDGLSVLGRLSRPTVKRLERLVGYSPACPKRCSLKSYRKYLESMQDISRQWRTPR